MSIEIVDRGSNSHDAVQYSSQPDEELCEVARSKEVSPGEDECDAYDEGEEDHGIGVEREVI